VCFGLFDLLRKGFNNEPQRTMFLLVSSLLLAVVVVGSSDTDDLRSLVESLKDHNAKLTAVANELGEDIAKLRQQYDYFIVATTTQRDKDKLWRLKTAERLESLAGSRRLSTAVSTKRRGLASGTCADPNAPELLVEGVCICTEGLLVEGRNISKELDTFFEAAATTTTSTSTSFTSTTTTLLSLNCSAELSNPIIVGNVDGAVASQIVVAPSGKYSYVTNNGAHSLHIVDVENVSCPRMVGTFKDNDNMTFPWGLAISSDGHFVLVRSKSRLSVIDVQNPSAPSLVGSVEIPSASGTNFVVVSPDEVHAFTTCAGDLGLIAVDIGTDPYNPTILGHVGNTSSSLYFGGVTLSSDGKYAYATEYLQSSFMVFDVGTDPANITRVGSIDKNTQDLWLPRKLAVGKQGQFVYVAATEISAVTVIDVGTNTSAPTVAGSIKSFTPLKGADDIALSPDGKFAYVSAYSFDTFTVLDVKTNPTQPSIVGWIQNTTHMDSPYAVAVAPDGNSIYVGCSKSNNMLVLRWQNCTASN